MTKLEALALFDNDVAEISSALRVAPQTFYSWRVIPFHKQCVLEVVTEGELKAEYQPQVPLTLKKYLMRELGKDMPPKLRKLLQSTSPP